MSQDKAKTLKITTDQIEQKFGKGAIMKLGKNTNMQVGVIPTGALPLDIALGIGGVPRGRIVEVYALNQAVKRPLLFISLLRRRLQVVLLPLSTPSMRWILSMPLSLV